MSFNKSPYNDNVGSAVPTPEQTDITLALRDFPNLAGAKPGAIGKMSAEVRIVVDGDFVRLTLLNVEITGQNFADQALDKMKGPAESLPEEGYEEEDEDF